MGMLHFRPGLIWAALLAIGVAGPSAAHAASWSAPVHPLAGTFEAHVAANARGDVVVAAASYDDTGLRVSVRPAGGAFEPPVTVGSGSAGVADVGLSANGTVVVGWGTGNGTIHFATRPAGGAFGAATDIPNITGALDFVKVGVDDAGEVAAAWLVPNGQNLQLNGAIRRADGTLGPVVPTLAPAGALFDVAMNSRGDAVVTGTSSDGANPLATAATRATGDSSFGPFVTLSPPGAPASSPVADIDAGGRAAVAWTRGSAGSSRTQVSTRSPGGLFTVATDASPAGGGADYPGVAVSPNEVAASWTGNGAASVRIAPLNSPFTAPITAFAGGQSRSTIAMAPNGATVVGYGDGTGMAAAYRAPGGTFGSAQAVAPKADQSSNVAYTPVAMDGSGDAVAAWSDDTGLGVSFLDVTPPELRDVSVSPTAFSVSTWDAFSAVGAPRWDFGDGSAADGARVTHRYAKPGTYLVTVSATDAAGNAASATRPIAVPAPPPVSPPPAPPVAATRCKVPSLIRHTTGWARTRLKGADCALGRVTTPKRYKKRKGLVIRSQSRKAGTAAAAGAKVNVTLGPKPKAKTKPKTHSKR